jgi:hypothetical protein
MERRSKIEPDVEKKLSLLKDTFTRDPIKAAAGKEAYLAAAQQLRREMKARQEKHTGKTPANYRSGLAKSPALRMLLPIFMAVALVMGTGVVTVAASKNSQPEGALYSVKLASEDISLELSQNPAKRFDFASQFVQNRATEIFAMVEEGKIPSTEVVARYQEQIERALRLAVNLPDDEAALSALASLQVLLEDQKDTLVGSMFVQPEELGAVVREMLVMVNIYVNQCIDGQENLAWLREQYQTSNPTGNAINSAQSSSTPDPSGSTSTTGNNGNPQATHTRTPGAGNSQGGGNDKTKTHTPPAWGQGGKDTRTPTATPEGYDPTSTKVPPGQEKKDD